MNRTIDLPGNKGREVGMRWLPLIPGVCHLHRTSTNHFWLNETLTSTHGVIFDHTLPDTGLAPRLDTRFSRKRRDATRRREVVRIYVRRVAVIAANPFRFAHGRLLQLHGFLL